MTFPDFVEFIADNVNQYSGVPGIVFFVLFYKRMGKIAGIVFLILSASFLADIANHILINVLKAHRTNSYVTSYIAGNIWFLTNFFLVSALFYRLVASKKKFILGLVGGFCIGTVISFIGFYDFNESNTFIRAYTSISFTILPILAFFEILRASPIEKLKNLPAFWIVGAIFLYSSITLLRNLFTQYLVFDMEISWELYSYVAFFNLLFNIAKNLMFFYALILIKRGYPDYIYPPKPATA